MSTRQSQPNVTIFSPLTLAQARTLLREKGPHSLAELVWLRSRADVTNSVIAQDPRYPELSPGPLSGLPIGVKDNIDALPYATTGGSPGLTNFRPGSDAPSVARVRAAGAWISCKLNLHELAFGVTSNNKTYGPVRNPFDLKRSAGGSSGGSAAAVATGIVCAALGTDTGGSIRIPSAFCNVVGFRPSSGRYPAGGVLTLSRTRDTVGIIASSVEDLCEIDAVMTGYTLGEPSIAGKPIRLGLPEDALSGICPTVDEDFRKALNQLHEAGIIEIITVPAMDYERIDPLLGNPIVFNEALDVWTEFCRKELSLDLQTFSGSIAGSDVRAIFRQLETLAGETRHLYQSALSGERNALQIRFQSMFERYNIDVIAAPTVSVQPPLIGEDDEMEANGRSHPVFPTVTRNCALATVTGAPSLALPVGRDRDGFPLSLMIEGPIGSDKQLLERGKQIEAALYGVQ